MKRFTQVVILLLVTAFLPAHLVLVGWLVVQCERIQRTCRGVQMTLREMQVDGRFFQVLMAEQELNSAEISASFEKVCGKAVPQQMRMHTFLNAGALSGSLAGVARRFRINRVMPGMPAIPGKEPIAGFSPQATPVLAQFVEQLRAEHDIAVLAAFSSADMNHHALAVDIADLQVC